MSTETQRKEFEKENNTLFLDFNIIADEYRDPLTQKFWATWQAAQASQAAEIEALKAKLASYEAHGVTCQTFGHVVGACAECNTHEESKEAEIAASEQATENEKLRKWIADRKSRIDAAMQTKEAS